MIGMKKICGRESSAAVSTRISPQAILLPEFPAGWVVKSSGLRE